MPDEFVKTNKSLNKFLKYLVGLYLNHIFCLESDIKSITDLKPPYVVIANHVNFWDPFLISLCIPEHIYFVTSDSYFRNPVLRRLLKLVGAIPKIKFVNDPQTIRGIIEVNKHGGVTGIFPEGRRNWDGNTLPLRYATAKLIKNLNAPVVAVLLKGGCLSFPRWAVRSRKGKIELSCKMLLNKEDLLELSVNAIYEIITNALENDEYEYQRQHMNRYNGKRLAEKLELFLFICPQCYSIGTLKSCGDMFRCKTCNYNVKYDEYCFFKTLPGRPLFFETPQDWNTWQLNHLKLLILEKASNSGITPLFEESNLLALTGARFKPLKALEYGTLAMYTDKVIFTGLSGKAIVFCISHINGENIQSNNKLEFYNNNILYRFIRSDKCLSAYKWVKALEIVKNSII